MRALVVGRDGLIGGALFEYLKQASWDVVGTQRRRRGEFDYLDLAEPPALHGFGPQVDCAHTVAYLVAAVTGFERCEGSKVAHRVNVDAPIALADELLRLGCFVVFLSSEAVEWSASAYARQKMQVECFLRGRHAAIVRPAKVTRENVDELCYRLARIGSDRAPGVYHWPEPHPNLARAA